jgi:hypothetical protein
MIDLDFKKMAIGVEKRLDEIFADDLQIQNPNRMKFECAKPPSLESLRNIIKSLEWEVTENHLNDLIREVSRLQRVYIRDDLPQKLFRILFILGRYIKVYQSDTHPHVFKMLFRVFRSLEKIVTGKYSHHKRAQIVNDEIKRYLSLKDYLKRKTKNRQTYRRTVNQLNASDKSGLSPTDSKDITKPYRTIDNRKIYHHSPENNFKKLKKNIYLELKKIRSDLQRIVEYINQAA